MAQAIMDPEEVRRFATELKRFNDDVQAKASSLQARFAALGATWQDQRITKNLGRNFSPRCKGVEKNSWRYRRGNTPRIS